MSFKKTIQVLNQITKEGLIGGYALAGGMAALLYVESFATRDMDVLVEFNVPPSGIVSLSGIHQRLSELGFTTFDKEGVVIGDWPVQFLPITTPLDKEAFDAAKTEYIDGEPLKVLGEEYLMAIALAVGGNKYRSRIISFIESGKYDHGLIEDIVKRHGLQRQWDKLMDGLEEEHASKPTPG